MMKKLLVFGLLCIFAMKLLAWGFFGHQLINRIAVFTLPEKLMGFYKQHIEFITEHAVDPDKRRYSDPEEACRHYVDLDYYEQVFPIDTVPLYWKDAVAKYTEDTLKAYGIVPWHVQKMMYRLTAAFKEKDQDKILRSSAEIGHYIADACVPLHATMNYNGQMTGQKGIHGFWESRLPELFSENYDFFVGRARYIDNVQQTIWQASAGSFNAKDSVLLFEKELNERFPSDQKYVFEQKGQTQVKIYSKAYAEAYNKMLSGMVERRMRLSISLVGCLWYTAWVDAGQPDISEIKQKKMKDAERKAEIELNLKEMQERKMLGRPEN